MASGKKELRKVRQESERQGWRWVEKRNGWMGLRVASLSRCKFARPRLPVEVGLCGDHLLSGRPLGSLA